jgi:hypothetical protein
MSAAPADIRSDQAPGSFINCHECLQVNGNTWRVFTADNDEPACKPDSVSRSRGPAAIHLGLPSPTASAAAHPQARTGRPRTPAQARCQVET